MKSIRTSLTVRRIVSLFIHAGLVTASYLASFFLRLDLDISQIPFELVFRTLPLLVAVRIVTLVIFRLHKGLWQYVSVLDLMQIIQATTISTLLFVVLEILVFDFQQLPRSIFILDWAGNILLLSSIRLTIRLIRERYWPNTRSMASSDSLMRLLIVGADDAGANLCKQALSNKTMGVNPVAFVTNDDSKVGRTILGIPIAGTYNDIDKIFKDHLVEIAVLANTEKDTRQTRNLLEACNKADIICKILTPTSELFNRTSGADLIKDVDPIDLLGRKEADLDLNSIKNFICNKRILITGASGSIGSELSRLVIGLQPESLIMLDKSENSLFFLESELQRHFPHISIVVRVGDVTDEVGMGNLMDETQPNVVFHAAAHKHVPLMERTPAEAISNNVGGTLVMSKLSINNEVDTFVLVSTDKAVNPTSVMGATKRLSELIVQDMDGISPTRFVSVRFGNVLGSNASVVPIFEQQIKEGGPVTVTHPNVERYFMSVSEASGLILQAASIGKGGQIFVLDMGNPVKIVDLAEMVIVLSGLEPNKDIEIRYTGLRSGEKMSEELHFGGEDFESTEYEKLLVLRSNPTRATVLDEAKSLLNIPQNFSPSNLKAQLRDIVPEYTPDAVEFDR